MKILGKNIYIGDKCLCTEYTSKLLSNDNEIHIGEKSHKSDIIEKNVLFIKDKEGYFIDIRDTEGLGSFAIRVFGAAPRWKATPHGAGDKYVEVTPYFSEIDYEKKFDLKDLVEIATSKREITL